MLVRISLFFTSSWWRRGIIALLVALPPISLLLVVHHLSFAAPAVAHSDQAAPERDVVGSFFLGATVVLVCCLAAGKLASLLGQPRVMGEIAAGVMLGPSLLGLLAPDFAGWLFSSDVLPLMTGVAQVGLVLFMFGVGQELSTIRLRGTSRQVLMIGQGSLMVPLAAGTLAALLLFDGYLPPGVHPGVFAVFVGCALSITAFPVLAHILEEKALSHTRVGQLSLLVTAVGDLGSWIVLGIVVTVAHGAGLLGATAASLAAVCVAAIFLGPLRGLLRRWPANRLVSGEALMVLTIAVIATAALTSALGVHQLIGALLVGIIWPTRHPVFGAAAAVIAGARPILLPFFFFGFGLSIDLTSLREGSLLVLACLLLLAAVTKLLGVGAFARLSGLPWRESCTLGVLLNTRGLTELVVLQAGYEAGIIGPELFAILTAVALLTTFMTGPLLRMLGIRGRGDHNLPEAAPDSPTPDAGGDTPRTREHSPERVARP